MKKIQSINKYQPGSIDSSDTSSNNYSTNSSNSSNSSKSGSRCQSVCTNNSNVANNNNERRPKADPLRIARPALSYQMNFSDPNLSLPSNSQLTDSPTLNRIKPRPRSMRYNTISPSDSLASIKTQNLYKNFDFAQYPPDSLTELPIKPDGIGANSRLKYFERSQFFLGTSHESQSERGTDSPQPSEQYNDRPSSLADSEESFLRPESSKPSRPVKRFSNRSVGRRNKVAVNFSDDHEANCSRNQLNCCSLCSSRINLLLLGAQGVGKSG